MEKTIPDSEWSDEWNEWLKTVEVLRYEHDFVKQIRIIKYQLKDES